MTKSDFFSIRSGSLKLDIDTRRTGQITYWQIGEKILVCNQEPKSPLEIKKRSMDSCVFTASSYQKLPLPDGFAIKISGYIAANSTRIDACLEYHVESEGGRISVFFSQAPQNTNRERSEISWSLPLGLGHRKRIYFRGDYGLEWDSRYFYQFTSRPTGQFLPQPDRNEWRYFCLDQFSSSSFRLWKAESDKTSPLIMQEGETASPFLQIYDPYGGITVEYPYLNEAGAVSLRVDAADGGSISIVHRAEINQHLPTDAIHDIQPVILIGNINEKAVLDARLSLKSKYPARPFPNPIPEEQSWLKDAEIDNAYPQYVVGGYPFSKSELKVIDEIHVCVNGEKTSSQAKPLAYWDDGSIKWASLVFPFAGENAINECEAPRISLRTGGFLPVQVSCVENPKANAPFIIEIVRETESIVEISNGDLMVELATGQRWIQKICYDGRPILDTTSSRPLCFVDYVLNPETVSAFEGFNGGEPDPGILNVEKITVEERGPLRVVVKLEGHTNNREPTRIILRVTLFAGRPELQISHTVEFLFKDPRKTFLKRMGIEIPLVHDFIGEAGLGEEMLLQYSPQHARHLFKHNDDWESAPHETSKRCWIDKFDESLRIAGVIRNFREQAPKALSTDPGNMRFDFWPEDAGPMDVRRYSNYPHVAQGEAIMKPREDWAEVKFYPDDPFVGISRSDEILIGIYPRKAKIAVSTLAADFQSPALFYAGRQRYESTETVVALTSHPLSPRAEKAWTNLANFWLFHRALHSWYGFWNFGDIRHRFQDGFGSTHSAATIRDLQLQKGGDSHLSDATAPCYKDYFPPNDWAYDNGRWGWTNTEGLPNLFFLNEYMRHGNRVVYFAAEAMARHARDVITRHAGKWFGAGTRHGVQHWSDDNHEERQTTITEYRHHYFLSGDARTRDVIEKLYEGVYSKTRVDNHAAHSGRLGGLLFHWEITGFIEEKTTLNKYIQLFLSHEGLFISPVADFPGPVQAGDPEGLNDGSMFFHTFGGMHALIEYHQITKDEALRESLIKFADTVVQDPQLRDLYLNEEYIEKLRAYANIFWPVIAFGAIHASDPSSYRGFLIDYLKASGWMHLYLPVTQNPRHWTGNTAHLDGNVSFNFFWNNWAPYIVRAIGLETIESPEITTQLDLFEKNGFPKTASREDWQLEYDTVDSSYINDQQPWRNVR